MRRHGTRRCLLGGLRAPSSPVSLYYVQPAGTADIVVGFLSIPLATQYEIWKSTDGVAYSLVTTITAPYPNLNGVDISGLTRQTKYWFKVRGKNSAGRGPFGAANYTWPVDTTAINYAGNPLGGNYQNIEMLWVDQFDTDLIASGMSITSWDWFLLFSPTACSASDEVGALYDIIWGTGVHDSDGGTYTSSGFNLNYNGYISLNYPPFQGGGALPTGSKPSQFLACMNVASVPASPLAGYANRHAFMGMVDGGNDFEVGYFNNGGNNVMFVTDNSASASAVATISHPLSNFIGAYSGMDIDSGLVGLFSAPGTTSSDSNPDDGSWDGTYGLYLGAANDGGSVNYLMAGTINFFCFGGAYLTDTDRLNVYYALAAWNAKVGR